MEEQKEKRKDFAEEEKFLPRGRGEEEARALHFNYRVEECQCRALSVTEATLNVRNALQFPV